MKKSCIRILSLVLALCALCGALTSCANKLKMKKDKFVSSKTGVEYSVVRSVYLPKSVSDEVYAVFEKNGVKIQYFEVEGLNPEEWLVSDQNDFLYAGDIKTLPSFAEFGANEMLVCHNSDVLFSFIDEKNADQIAKIVERVSTVTPIEKNYYECNTYILAFASDKYPALYYRLKLAVTPDRTYVVDPSIGANYDVTDLFAGYPDLVYQDDEYDE